MHPIDEFKILVGGYFGIQEMDEYPLKVYVLKNIEDYIIKYLKINPISDFNYNEEAEKIKDSISLKRKLQDSLLVLRKINGSFELEMLVKEKIRNLNNE